MVQKTVLDNGIRILTEHISGAFSATVGFWLECGSRHEPAAQSGVSHFLEHMLFKGTDRYSAPAIAKKIDGVGGALNAFTGCEYSCYYAKVAGEHLPLAIDLLADILQNSIIDLDELEKERRVILQEIHMLEESPEDSIHEVFIRSFWQKHPLGQSVIGSIASIQNLERDDLVNYLDRYYGGTNLIVCCAGDVEHGRLVEQVARLFQNHPPGNRHPEGVPPVCHGGIDTVRRDLEQVHFCLGTTGPHQRHAQRFAGNLLNTMLGGSMSSRLFQTLREERGMAYSVYSYLNSHSDAAALVVYAGISPAEIEYAINLALKELSHLKHCQVDDEELQAAKNLLNGQFMLSLESTENRMTRLAKNEIYLGHVQSPQEIVQVVQKVSAEEIMELTDDFFRDENLRLQMVGPVSAAGFPVVDLTLG